MDYGSPDSTPPASAVLNDALHARGFELADFRVDIRSVSAWGPSPAGARAVIQVRCRSTGEERVYPIGSSSAWLGAFVMDLAGGHFAHAARRRDTVERAGAARSVVERLLAWRRELRGIGRLGRRLALTTSP